MLNDRISFAEAGLGAPRSAVARVIAPVTPASMRSVSLDSWNSRAAEDTAATRPLQDSRLAVRARGMQWWQDAAEYCARRAVPLTIVVVLHGLMLLAVIAGLVRSPPAAEPAAVEVRFIAEQQVSVQPPPPPPVVPQQPRIDISPPPLLTVAELPPSANAITVTRAPPVVAAEPAPAAAAPVQTAPRFDADYLSNPAPAYPAISRRMREEGLVLLRVRVTPAGDTAQVLIERSSGWPRLDEAAVGAVSRWRFVPARRGEAAVEGWVIVPVEFSLRR